MDNLLEYIVPLVFAAIYFFGNMMSKKEGDDASPAAPRRQQSPDEAEAAARQRKIQEEIRRKIMERRQAAEREDGAAPVVPAPAQPERGRLTDYDRQLQKRGEAAAARRATPEVVRQPTPPRIPKEAPASKVEEVQSRGFSWDTSDNAYETQMQEQLRRIEATKRQAAQLKKQAAAAGVKTESKRRSGSGRSFSGPVREQLQDPAAARAAFIYGEVLGQPVSLRKQSSVPGLS